MIFLIFTIIIAAALNAQAEHCSTCIKSVQNNCYNISHLSDIEAPFGNRAVITKLAMLASKNELYFTFIPPLNDDGEIGYYKTGYINLDSPKNLTIIDDGDKVLNFETFDLDQENALVYLGGNDGIYLYDSKQSKPVPFIYQGNTVVRIFYKDQLYFVRDGDFKIVKKEGDDLNVVADATGVSNFVISEDNVVVYLTLEGLYASYNGEEVLLSSHKYFGMAVSNYGDVYVWRLGNVYRVVTGPTFANTKLVKIMNIPHMGVMGFDSNNDIIYNVRKSLYRLTKMSDKVDC